MTRSTSSGRSSLSADSWWVVCLCAAWCNTCGDYRTTFDAVASKWPTMRFEWLDIEDESDLIGDIDVETFPTLLVADGDHVHFFGPLLPQEGVLNRLIASLTSAETPVKPTGSGRDGGALESAQALELLSSLRKARGLSGT